MKGSAHLGFDVVDIIPETCTGTGKIEGSFTIRLSNADVKGGYSVIDTKGNEVRSGEIIENRIFENRGI